MEVRAARQLLVGALAGSLALHAVAVGVALVAFASTRPSSTEEAAITVFIPPEEPGPSAPALAPDFIPAPEEPPPPEFKMADPQLPAPAEPPPPPDFKTQRPKPPSLPPPRPAQAAPRAAPHAAETPAPSTPSVASPAAPAAVAPNWNALLGAWLASHRKYPESSRRRGEEGDVTVRFTVAPEGHVLDVTIVTGSSHAALDAAALAMLQGATVPAPGSEVTRMVRIRFRLGD